MKSFSKADFSKLLKSLDEKHGNHQNLDSIILKFYQNLEADPMVGFFFYEKDLSSIASRQCQFLRRANGLTTEYVGKSPSVAHIHLPPILPGFFDRRLRILEDTLRQNGLTDAQIENWIAFEESFRNVVES